MKYKVVLYESVSYELEVEADNEDDAFGLAVEELDGEKHLVGRDMADWYCEEV